MAREVNASTPDFGPGTYQDPQSGKILKVTMNAAADALVRMGWKLVSDEAVSAQTSDAQDPAGRVDSPAPAIAERESIDEAVA